MRKITILLSALLMGIDLFANDPKEDSISAELNKYVRFADSVNTALKYETGSIQLSGGFAKLNIPKGFKFLNAEQSKFVLHKVWGNPKRDDILGMVFPEKNTPFSDSSYAFIVSFDEMGYVKDDDASKINYDDLLKEMQADEKEVNKNRASAGYEPIHMVGWAQKPYYDDKNKVLHWAKELKFGNSTENTLNYDIRILGRRGVLSLNAVGNMSELALVNKDIQQVLAMAVFTEGNTYKEFDSNIDKVAAYGIGGLIAGKILLKAGFWVMILKFWKLIVAGIVGAWFLVKKFILGKKEQENNTAETTSDSSENETDRPAN